MWQHYHKAGGIHIEGNTVTLPIGTCKSGMQNTIGGTHKKYRCTVSLDRVTQKTFITGVKSCNLAWFIYMSIPSIINKGRCTGSRAPSLRRCTCFPFVSFSPQNESEVGDILSRSGRYPNLQHSPWNLLRKLLSGRGAREWRYLRPDRLPLSTLTGLPDLHQTRRPPGQV